MSERKSAEQFFDGSDRFFDGPSREDALLLELLVDDELEEPRRRELLERLDTVPNGWRALATAFLESQCLARALGKNSAAEAEPSDRLTIGALSAAAGEPAAEAAGTYAKSAGGDSATQARWRRRVVLRAMAGGILLAFVMSAAAALLVRPALGPRDGGVSTSAPSVSPGTDSMLAAGALAPASADPFDVPVHRVRLNTEANDLAGISLPCVESDHYDPALLHTPSTSEYIEHLRRDGRQVDCTTEHLTIPLEDGRKAIVPVDTITIRRKDKPAFPAVIYQ